MQSQWQFMVGVEVGQAGWEGAEVGQAGWEDAEVGQAG